MRPVPPLIEKNLEPGCVAQEQHSCVDQAHADVRRGDDVGLRVQAAQPLDIQAVVKYDSIGVCGKAFALLSHFIVSLVNTVYRLTYPHDIFAVFGPSI